MLFDQNGKTALQVAAKKNHVVVVQLLLAYGANANERKRVKNIFVYYHSVIDIDMMCVQRKPVLCIACDKGRVEVVKLLLQYGAKVNEKIKVSTN